jgi:anti-sigma B factor antagonist
VLDLEGIVNGRAEQALKDAHSQNGIPEARYIILNFSQVTYMNSTGIGVLVTLLVRANRYRQRILAYGLKDHYRKIFQMIRLDEAITIFDGEIEALATV